MFTHMLRLGLGIVLLAAGAVATQRGAAQDADVSSLVGQLKSTDAEQQIAACKQLATLGAKAQAALPALTSALDSDNSQVRAYAAYAIGAVHPADGEVVEALIKHVVDKDATVRRKVRDALRAINAPRERVRPLMLEALKSANPADAAAAMATLAELGEAVLPDLCAALDDEHAQYWACLALADLGSKAKAAIPQLTKVLQSKDPDIRMQALLTLAEIGPDAKATAPQIVNLLNNDPFESVRYAAAYALGCLGQQVGAIEALTKALDNQDAFLSVAGAWGLLRLSDSHTPLVDRAVAAVMVGLQSQDPAVRQLAARALADDDFPRDTVKAALRQALEGIENEQALEDIADALASVGPKVVPACIRSLEQKRKLRRYAILVLIKLGAQAADAVPALIQTLDDPEPELRREAAFALGAIGPRAEQAVPALVARLEDSAPEVQYAACYALGKIGPGAKAALRPLHQAMQGDDAFLEMAAVWASLKIAPDNPYLKKAAVPILVKALEHPADHVRAEVAGLLGDIGPEAQAAVEPLKKLLDDPHPMVRQAATEALAKITGAAKS